MKAFQRNLLPEIHINPINRDLVLIGVTSVLVAVAFVTVGVMVMSEF